MANENEFLLHALFMGIFVTFVYDILRIFRRVIPHNNFFVSLEDCLFWVYCAIRVFLLMYHESNGTLRWFAIFGALSGMYVYMRLVSPFFVKYVSWLLQKLLHILGKILGFLLRPVVRFIKRIRERLVRAAKRRAVKIQKKKELGRGFLHKILHRMHKITKKKLTYLRKVLKMDV